MSDQSEKSYLTFEPARRNYYFQMPNIIDDLNLDPFAFRLYSHLKRVAGDHGKCFQSVTTMAEKCGMSRPSIIEAKKELLKPRKELNGKALIHIIKEKGGSDKILIIDVWNENEKKFNQSTPLTGGSQPRLLKEEPIKNDDVADASQLKKGSKKDNALDYQHDPTTEKAVKMIDHYHEKHGLPKEKLRNWIEKYGKDYLIDSIKCIEKKRKQPGDFEGYLAVQLRENFFNVDNK